MTSDLPPFHPRRHALERPDDIAFRISTTGETVTFGQLEARANQGAHLFRQHGLTRGDHIVILMENRREFLEICFAADRTGLYYTTASTHLADDEIRHIPIIAITAFAMKGDEERIRSKGCEAYLSKPISVSKFVETVRTYIGDT